ncbi:MAG: PleD family two-component system response regulator, partial [Anaerolineae bacterium]
RTLTFILEKAGYMVATADSGAAALAQAQVVRPRLILLDCVMPDMSGGQVVEMMRDDPVLRDTRVIMVTGSDVDEAPATDGYIPKPFKPEQVLATVAAVVDRDHNDRAGQSEARKGLDS